LSQVRSEPSYLASLLITDRAVQSAYSCVFMDAFFLVSKVFILYWVLFCYERIYCLALKTMETVVNFLLLSTQNTDFISNGHFVHVGNTSRLLVTIFLLFFSHDEYSADLQHCFTD